MGFFNGLKEAIGESLELSNYNAQSDIEFYNLTAINPLELKADVRRLLTKECTDLWNATDRTLKTGDFTVIKLATMCRVARIDINNRYLHVYEKALEGLCKYECNGDIQQYHTDVIYYVRISSGIQLYS